MHAERTPDYALLDAWREQGDDRANPLAFHYMTALQRRLEDHRGDARQGLEERLSGLITAYAECLGQREATAVHTQPITAPTMPARGALAELADTLARRAAARAGDAAPAIGWPTHEGPTDSALVGGTAVNRSPIDRAAIGSVATDGTPIHGTPTDGTPASRAAVPLPELDALTELRRLWSSVRSDSQVKRALQHSPDNAGPLNSSSLVYRSLSLMREVSPGYLQQFLAYVDALAWLQQMKDGGILGDRNAPAAPGHKTRARAKPRKRPG